MVKKKEKSEKGIVESFLGEMPVFGDFFKELAKTETFKERFKEVDEKIKENLKKKKWSFEAKVSVKPLIERVRKDEGSEISVHEDYIYGKKRDKLILAVKVPQEKVNLDLKGKILFITANNFKKEIKLPDYFRWVKITQHKNGILTLELTK